MISISDPMSDAFLQREYLVSAGFIKCVTACNKLLWTTVAESFNNFSYTVSPYLSWQFFIVIKCTGINIYSECLS